MEAAEEKLWMGWKKTRYWNTYVGSVSGQLRRQPEGRHDLLQRRRTTRGLIVLVLVIVVEVVLVVWWRRPQLAGMGG